MYIVLFYKKTTVSYIKPNPPNYIQSFTGSALPYNDALVAFENTENRGSFRPTSSKFSIMLKFPNAYYSHLGTRLMPPHVRITVHNGISSESKIIELTEAAPFFRLLSYQSNPVPRVSPTFYDRSHLQKPRSQEEILRSSGYRLSTLLIIGVEQYHILNICVVA